MQDANVMIIGSGAREHVLCNAYEKSNRVKKIIIAPGNDFIAFNRHKEVIIDKNCSLKDKKSIIEAAKKHKPDLIEVAQDNALALGVVDTLKYEGFRVFGPTKKAARLEWDKKWSRELMVESKVPVPNFKTFKYSKAISPEAKDYITQIYKKNSDKVLYIKSSGLNAGKGALKSTHWHSAAINIESMDCFNNVNDWFLIEEGVVGEEFSYYVITDGKNFKTFKSAQDNKTVFNFDEGDQTGGMGAVSPALVTRGIESKIEDEQISRIIKGLQDKGINYTGIIYLGGIITNNGILNIEYNARWGDPEVQAILPGLKTDYFEVINSCLDGKLNEINLQQDDLTRVCVVGASKGYPGNYDSVRGKRIFGLESAMQIPSVEVFGAGISMQDHEFYANGGRLFSVVGSGKDVVEAKRNAYNAISMISIQGNNLHYRTDIGFRDVERFNNKY